MLTTAGHVGAALAGVGTFVLLAGCTSSGSVPGPASSAVRSTVSSGAPPTSTVTTCTPSTTKLTYRKHTAVLGTYSYTLPPGNTSSTPSPFPQQHPITSVAPGLGRGAGLVGLVHNHWRAFVYPLHATTTSERGGTHIGLNNKHSRHNTTFVVYQRTAVFTGSYASVCGGRAVRGTYRLFGSLDFVLLQCGTTVHAALDRSIQRRACKG